MHNKKHIILFEILLWKITILYASSTHLLIYQRNIKSKKHVIKYKWKYISQATLKIISILNHSIGWIHKTFSKWTLIIKCTDNRLLPYHVIQNLQLCRTWRGSNLDVHDSVNTYGIEIDRRLTFRARNAISTALPGPAEGSVHIQNPFTRVSLAATSATNSSFILLVLLVCLWKNAWKIMPIYTNKFKIYRNTNIQLNNL